LPRPARHIAAPPVPGIPFDAPHDSSIALVMSNEWITIGPEHRTHHTNVPYFSGHGGVTSPNGWNAPIGDPTGYTADPVQDEDRIILSLIVRC
jgi:hypothetical protein